MKKARVVELPPTQIPWIAVLLLVLFAAIPYLNTFGVPLLFDDEGAIRGNSYLEDLSTGAWIWKTPENTTLSGRPVAQWTFALNQGLMGGGLAAMHMVNLCIHAVSAVALFGLVRKLLRAQGSTGSVSDGAAWLAALVWAVHPLNTQAVTYLVQRTESLMVCCYLSTLLAAWKAWQSRGWRLVAVLACALGMGTKESMVSAPLAVILIDVCFVRRPLVVIWRERKAFYGALMATWFILALSLATSTIIGLHARSPMTPWDYLRVQVEVIFVYLRLVLWPSPLVFDYYDWPIPEWTTGWWLKSLFLAVGLGVGLWGGCQRRGWAAPILIFFTALAPTSSVLPLWDPVVEYRMVLPLAALALLLALCATSALHVSGVRFPAVSRMLERGVMVLMLGVAAALAWTTHVRNRDYQTEASIWRDTTEKRPANPRAWQNLGEAMVDAGRFEEGIRYLEHALSLPYRPGLAPAAHYNLANAYLDLKRFEDALRHYDRAIGLLPNYPRARANRALVFMHLRDFASAARDQQEALSILWDDPVLHVQHAIVLEKLGEYSKALVHLHKAESLGHKVPSKLAEKIRSRL